MEAEALPNTVNGISGKDLQSIIERIESITDHKSELQSDITQIYAEAKGKGFDAKIIRQIIRLRAKDKEERSEEETLLAIYMRALGMDE